jgi:hypothetical protein
MRMKLISYLFRIHFVDTRKDPDNLITLEENLPQLVFAQIFFLSNHHFLFFIFFDFLMLHKLVHEKLPKKKQFRKKFKKQVKTILKILGPTETKRRRKNYRYYCSLDSAAAAMWMFVVYG